MKITSDDVSNVFSLCQVFVKNNFFHICRQNAQKSSSCSTQKFYAAFSFLSRVYTLTRDIDSNSVRLSVCPSRCGIR